MLIQLIQARMSGFLALSLMSFLAVAESATPANGQRLLDALKSGGTAPELVAIPDGHYVMGSAEEEAGRYPNEGPQHLVSFAKPFAIGRTEVTVGEFRRFVEATGYLTTAERGAFRGSLTRNTTTGQWEIVPTLNWRLGPQGDVSGDDMPVIHVSWEDAYVYTSWLSVQTGRRYRLPSEAELEYVNRAGSDSEYSWGSRSPAQRVANLRGEGDIALMPASFQVSTQGELDYLNREGPSPQSFADYGDGFGELSPVASFAPNRFGVFDTTGNVWEWAQDCWHDSYEGAPTDGSAWMAGGNCDMRVLRGGSWYCFPRHLRSANRWGENRYFRNMYVGFRVARDI